MSDLTLETLTNDLELSNGDLVLTSGIDARRQHVSQRLKTFFSEWFLDLSIGVPYFEHVFVKAINPIVLDTIFKSAILNTRGIIELLEFDIDLEGSQRLMTLSFKARALEGVIDFSLPLGGENG